MPKTIRRRDFLKSGTAGGVLATLYPVSAFAQSTSPGKAVKQGPIVYFNGQILTMEGDAPAYVEAVVVANGKIAFVGSKDAALAAVKGAQLVDLKGRTMVPGFIDLWGHFKLLAQQTLGVNISYFAEKPPRNKADVISLLKAAKPFNGWIIGYGYTDAMLTDGAPNLEELDAAFPTIPVGLPPEK